MASRRKLITMHLLETDNNYLPWANQKNWIEKLIKNRLMENYLKSVQQKTPEIVSLYEKYCFSKKLFFSALTALFIFASLAHLYCE